jgi:hypothetical protein
MEFKIRYLLTRIHIPICSFLQILPFNGTLQLTGQPRYQTCYIRTAHITVQDVGKTENTLVKFKIRNRIFEVIYQNFYIHAGSVLKKYTQTAQTIK